MTQVGRTAAFLCALALASAPAVAEPLTPLSVEFANPTDRYPHNVLGDLTGFGALDVTLADFGILRMMLPQGRVFEDVTPRLWDIDGDGVPEIVVVESDQQLGARLTAWSATRTASGDHTLELRAAGDFIGTRFRWLAPAAIADFTGDGRPEIAYVAMPHLAHQLVLVRLDGGRFVPLAQLDGVTNHRIGDDFITGGLRDCGDRPELLMASADWRHIIGVRYDNDVLISTNYGAFNGQQTIDALAECNR